MNETLRNAHATFDNGVLTITTGELARTWRWTGKGFVTTSLRDETTGREWARAEPALPCDWLLPGFANENPDAELTHVSAAVSDDEGFTSEHIEVVASMDYPDANAKVLFVVWVYPDSPGIRTQLRIMRTGEYGGKPTRATLRVDHAPVAFGDAQRRAIGYYNETQRRNDTHEDILKEHVTAAPCMGPEWSDWSSILCVEDAAGGMALVKESHKCPNQWGHDGGFFKCDPAVGLESAGWGVLPQEIRDDRYREAWASWCVVFAAGEDAREIAFKRFDRIRYPLDPKRDIYIMANTWGSGTDQPGDTGRDYANEDVALREIDSAADLGIDVQQIDDGWQSPKGGKNWQCDTWRPHPERYPEGWKRVREHAAQKGVTMGLWAAAQPISLEDLEFNFDTGDFRHYKLDFADLPSRDPIEALMEKVRAFIQYTGHQVRVNWDVTENPPRYGYFFAREYGLLYLENRKPRFPAWVSYRPHTVLRDLWQVAKYINLNKVQCSVQNVEAVDPNWSDARLHNHPYSVAIALMGTPLFFQLTSRYSPAARDQIRALLSVYKQHREEMYQGYVFPIGDKPSNRSWTGFQNHNFDTGAGYLTIFRELHNPEPEQTLRLRFVAGKTLLLAHLCRGEERTVEVGEDGKVAFGIGQPAGFLFCRYQEAE